MVQKIQYTDNLKEGTDKLNQSIDQSNAAILQSNNADQKSTQALNNSVSTQTQLDNIVVEGDSSVEAAQARVDSSGTSHPTLKSRLDNFEVSATQQLQHTATITEMEDIAINVKSFGAFGNFNASTGTGTDDTESIKNAIREAQKYANSTLIFPRGEGYCTSDTIVIPGTINVVMDAPIVYTGTQNIPALVIGKSGEVISNRSLKLASQRAVQSSWSDENSIGIKVINANSCSISIMRSNGYTIGVQCIGSVSGFAYNEVNLYRLHDNKVALDCTNELSGWCNENNFYGGRFSTSSSVHAHFSRYGTRITSKDGSYTNNNNNVFYKPSYELRAPTVGEAVPILLEYANNNTFLKIRNEFNSAITVRATGASTENYISTGYGHIGIEDFSAFPTNSVESIRTEYLSKINKVLYSTGPIHKNACYADGDNSINIPNVFLANSSNSIVYNAITGIALNSKYIEFPSTRGVGIFLNTSNMKKFVVRRDSEKGFGGRLNVRCYNKDGNILTSDGSNHPYVQSASSSPLSYSSNFSGVYRNGSDSSGDTFFKVGSEVDYVAVILSGGTSPLRLRSFAIFTEFEYSTTWCGYEEIVKGANIGISPPTAGTWEKGRIIWNSNLSSGKDRGWTCVAGGTPGIWESLGVL